MNKLKKLNHLFSRFFSLSKFLISFTICFFLGSCQPIENSSNELGDGTVVVNISESPVYVISAEDFSCVALAEKKPDEPLTSDIYSPRITLPNMRITWKSPSQYLKINTAFVLINFTSGKKGPYTIRNVMYSNTITPVYFVDRLFGPCSTVPISTVDQFDGRTKADIGSDRCDFLGQFENTYIQQCPFKIGGLPALKEWKSESSVVTASLYLQGYSIERIPADPVSPIEYPWASKVDFNIQNPCNSFPEICE